MTEDINMAEVINIVHCGISEVGKYLKGSVMEGCSTVSRVFVVCDRNVRRLAERIGFEADGIFELDATEGNKDFSTVVEIDRWLMEQGADRTALVLGIGGGITTDMTGFAASLYKR